MKPNAALSLVGLRYRYTQPTYSTILAVSFHYDSIPQFPIPNSPIPNSQFPIPNSQFSIPNSQFPIPNSQFSILNLPYRS
ncbi:MAG: hypothetical protein F6K41_02190 [Symploca sp. SIO3E6]|nr:hypothetical protein [Caldora sp. SIO3E6]